MSNAVVIVGQSQGAHAALSAAGLASAYVPTLTIKGTAATGLVGGPKYAASRRTSTLLFLILHKLQTADLTLRLSDYLTEACERAYAEASVACVRPGPTAAALPDVQYDTASAACRAGSVVETHYYPGQDHGGTVSASLVDSVPFVKKVLANERVAGNCATLKPPPAHN